MNEIFNEFKNNFENRFRNQSILNLGEDSVRYDFFSALMKISNLQSHEIQVEYPIHEKSFKPAQNPNSKRNENPKIDLYFSKNNSVLTAEFGLFKRNKNANGTINPTEKLFKMLNDMLRLALNNKYVLNDSYFICVADKKILGYKMKNKYRTNFVSFPAEKYSFNYKDLNEWINLSKSAKTKFDHRFVANANEIKLEINANRIYCEKIENPDDLEDNNLETKIIIYKVESSFNINK